MADVATRPLQQVADANEIQSIDPNTGELLGTVPVCGENEVRAAVARARAAQPGWGARPLRERIAVMRQVQEALVDHTDEITALVSREVGKVDGEALVGDVMLTLTSLAGYLKLAPRVLRTQRQRQGLLHSTKRTYIVHEPVGVVAVISPYNYPVLLSMQSVFAALIAGNAVVQKPSEFTPLSALKVQQILRQTDLPDELLQVVTGYGDTGRALVRAGVDYISFVGSSSTGRKVAAAAGEQLIPVTMELGGNNAMIVLDDAPISRAVDATLAWSMLTSGQVCGSVARVLVQRPIADDFTRRLEKRLADYRTSTDPTTKNTEVAAMVSHAVMARVEERVNDALNAGARALVGGGRMPDTEAPLFQPTVLVDVTPGMRVVREETFGPVITVLPVEDDAEAVRLANDTVYGLTASVWSRNNRRAWDIARQLEVGTVAVNDHLWPFFAPEVPWGGVKQSGIGRIGGEWGLRAMTYPKVISYDRLNLPREFYWPPYTAWVYPLFRQLIPLLYSRRLSKKLQALGGIFRALVKHK